MGTTNAERMDKFMKTLGGTSKTKQELEEERRKRQNLEEQMNDLIEEYTHELETAEMTKEEKAILETEVNKYKSQIENLSKEHEEHMEEIDVLVGQLGDLYEKKNTLEEEVETYKTEKKLKEQELIDYQDEVKRLSNLAEASQETLINMLEKVDVFKKEKEKAQDQLMHTKEEKEKIEEDYNKMSGDYNSLNEKILRIAKDLGLENADKADGKELAEKLEKVIENKELPTLYVEDMFNTEEESEDVEKEIKYIQYMADLDGSVGTKLYTNYLKLEKIENKYSACEKEYGLCEFIKGDVLRIKSNSGVKEFSFKLDNIAVFYDYNDAINKKIAEAPKDTYAQRLKKKLQSAHTLYDDNDDQINVINAILNDTNVYCAIDNVCERDPHKYNKEDIIDD